MKSMKKLTRKAGIILAETATMMGVLATSVSASITAPIGDEVSLSIAGLVNLIIQMVFGIGIIICIIFLVIYGIKYITAGDDVKAIEGARKGITGAIIGLIVIILTFAIIKIVAIFFLGSSDGVFNLIPESWSY